MGIGRTREMLKRRLLECIEHFTHDYWTVQSRVDDCLEDLLHVTFQPFLLKNNSSLTQLWPIIMFFNLCSINAEMGVIAQEKS